MKLIYEATHDAKYSLSCEMYYMSKLSEPFFMLWSNNPSVIMGKYQNMYEQVNLPYVKEHNIKLVRRYSGGGTVYTDRGGWQYSLFLPGMKTSETDFRREASAITDTINLLGANAYFSDRNDIYIEGRKVAGIAQFSNEFGLMHHLCMLYDTNLDVMFDTTVVNAEKIISKGIKSHRDRVTNIREHISRDLTSAEFAAFVFENIYGGKYETVEITPKDHAGIMEIYNRIFGNPDYVRGVNMSFDVKCGKRFEGGKVDVGLRIEGGKIADASFTGDFFFSGEISELISALGVQYDKDAVKRVLCAFENRFFLISSDDIVSLMFA